MAGFQQRAITEGREQFELELRDLLTKDLPEDAKGYPMPSALRKADTVIDQIMRLYDKHAPQG
jgi:hypothetical protein